GANTFWSVASSAAAPPNGSRGWRRAFSAIAMKNESSTWKALPQKGRLPARRTSASRTSWPRGRASDAAAGPSAGRDSTVSAADTGPHDTIRVRAGLALGRSPHGIGAPTLRAHSRPFLSARGLRDLRHRAHLPLRRPRERVLFLGPGRLPEPGRAHVARVRLVARGGVSHRRPVPERGLQRALRRTARPDPPPARNEPARLRARDRPRLPSALRP